MKWIDMISQAFSNLMRRKLRSALTMLGVVIGTAAIVVTISLGYGAEKTQMEALEQMANLRLINVYPHYGSYSGEGTNAGQRRITKITDGVVNEIRKVKGIDAVTPVANIWFGESYITTGKFETYGNLVAVIPRDFAKIQGLREGRYFSSNTSQMEFIMSEINMIEFRDPDKDTEWINVWEYLEAGEDVPLPKIDWLKAKYNLQIRWDEQSDSANVDEDSVVKTRDVKARMVGYIKADPNDYTFAYGAIVNLDWVKRFQRENKQFMRDRGIPILENYDSLLVLSKSVEDVTTIVKDLRDIGLNPYSALSTIEQMREQIRTMQGFLGFIGMISMFVAALSIANTMMMSIYERTREIGVMKVLGCKLGNIRIMFLSEAAFIGIFGGMLGLMLSYSLSYALNNVEALKNVLATVMSSTDIFGTQAGAMSIIPPELSLGTWAGVIVVSVLSGVQPAQRAMQLSSLAAIRAAD